MDIGRLRQKVLTPMLVCALGWLAGTGDARAGYIWLDKGIALPNGAADVLGEAPADPFAVLLPNGQVRLLFSKHDNVSNQLTLQSAISTDGINFTYEPGIRIAGVGAGARLVRLTDGRWRMFYRPGNCPGPSCTVDYGSAISSDGLSFTPEPGLRFTAASVGSSSISAPSALVPIAGGGWRAYFTDAPSVLPPCCKGSLYSATSSDQLTWTLDPGVRAGINVGASFSTTVNNPDLVVNPDGSILLFYGNQNPLAGEPGQATIQTMISTDGLTFKSQGPRILPPTIQRGDNAVVAMPDGSARLYYDHLDNATGITRIYVAQGVPAIVPAKGWWWNPAEGGRGYSIEVNSAGTIFFGAFMYAADGSPIWYTALGNLDTKGNFSATLNQYSGGQTLFGPYVPATLGPSPGQVSIAFSGSPVGEATTGILTLPGGAPLPIQRYDFVAGGSNAGPATGAPVSGWWWNPNQGGTGYFMEWQGSTAFMVAFMYDTQKRPVWYASTLSRGTDAAYVDRGRFIQYGGGQTLGGPFQAPATSADVGSVQITFSSSDPTALAITPLLTLPQPNPTIGIQRFVF